MVEIRLIQKIRWTITNLRFFQVSIHILLVDTRQMEAGSKYQLYVQSLAMAAFSLPPLHFLRLLLLLLTQNSDDTFNDYGPEPGTLLPKDYASEG